MLTMSRNRKMRNTPSAHARAAKKYRDKHAALGLCCSCPEPAAFGLRCKWHHAWYTNWRRKRNGVKKHYKAPFGKLK